MTRTPTRPTKTLVEQLDALHDEYVSAVNQAIEANDEERATRLAAAYDRAAIMLIAEREGRTDLLPQLLARAPRSRIARLAERLGLRDAA